MSSDQSRAGSGAERRLDVCSKSDLSVYINSGGGPSSTGRCHPDLFKPATTLLYHNEGNGKFTEVSQKVGVATPTKGLGVAINDYDHDGRVDILIANDAVPESLFRNKGTVSLKKWPCPRG
jgi:hypothetical protein